MMCRSFIWFCFLKITMYQKWTMKIENCQYARYWLTKVEDTTVTSSAASAADIK